MTLEDELNKLRKIITADDSKEEQITAAKQAEKILIDNAIGEAFKKIEERTNEYTALVERLKGVIERIRANQLTNVIENLDAVIKDVTEAAKKQG